MSTDKVATRVFVDLSEVGSDWTDEELEQIRQAAVGAALEAAQRVQP